MNLARATCDCSTQTGLIGVKQSKTSPGALVSFVGPSSQYLGLSEGDLIVAIDSKCHLLTPTKELAPMLFTGKHDIVTVSGTREKTLEVVVQRKSKSKLHPWQKRCFTFDVNTQEMCYYKDAQKDPSTKKGPTSIGNVCSLQLIPLASKTQLLDWKPTIYQLEASFEGNQSERHLEWKGDWQAIHKIAIILSKCSVEGQRYENASVSSPGHWSAKLKSPTRSAPVSKQSPQCSSPATSRWEDSTADDLQSRIDRVHNKQMESRENEIVSQTFISSPLNN